MTAVESPLSPLLISEAILNSKVVETMPTKNILHEEKVTVSRRSLE
jgi:hypothetical protein